jgi:hypothetical protein
MQRRGTNVGSEQESDKGSAGALSCIRLSTYTGRVEGQRLDTNSGMAGLPSLPERKIDEEKKALKLWVRRKRGNRKLICSGCGRRLESPMDVTTREVRDLPRRNMTRGRPIAFPSCLALACPALIASER